jgi:hypothetical protein
VIYFLWLKNYLNCKIIKTKDALSQTCVGKTDNLSKYMLAALGADENGEILRSAPSQNAHIRLSMLRFFAVRCGERLF